MEQQQDRLTKAQALELVKSHYHSGGVWFSREEIARITREIARIVAAGTDETVTVKNIRGQAVEWPIVLNPAVPNVTYFHHGVQGILGDTGLRDLDPEQKRKLLQLRYVCRLEHALNWLLETSKEIKDLTRRLHRQPRRQFPISIEYNDVYSLCRDIARNAKDLDDYSRILCPIREFTWGRIVTFPHFSTTIVPTLGPHLPPALAEAAKTLANCPVGSSIMTLLELTDIPRVTKIVAFGCNTMTDKRSDAIKDKRGGDIITEKRSRLQHGFFLALRDMLTRKHAAGTEIKTYAQDPAYDATDRYVLGQQGVEVVPGDSGFGLLDSETALVCFSPSFPIMELTAEVTRAAGYPALLIWYKVNVENERRQCLLGTYVCDSATPRVRAMLENYDEILHDGKKEHWFDRQTRLFDAPIGVYVRKQRCVYAEVNSGVVENWRWEREMKTE